MDPQILERTPLMQESWMPMLRHLCGDQDGPRWNARCGDRLYSEDLDWLKTYQKDLLEKRGEYHPSLPAFLPGWLRWLRSAGPWYKKRIPENAVSLKGIPVSQRRDLAVSLEDLIPLQAELSRLVINPSSGTTGEPLLNPTHPRTVGCYDVLIQYALGAHGVDTQYEAGDVAAVQLCYQEHTITYYTVHSQLKGAGFAKINLHPRDWPGGHTPSAYLERIRPRFLSGDPLAFDRAMKSGILYQPQALLSTALALSPDLRRQLEAWFQCPVVDMYSLNESGPLAYSCPHHPERWHLLPVDMAVEICDPEGRVLGEGTPGIITVSGGRNPFLPLLRYQTGDTASLHSGRCSCTDPMPWLENLRGREAVEFRNNLGEALNTLDISRVMQKYPVLQFQARQSGKGQVTLQLEWQRDPGEQQLRQLEQDLKRLWNSSLEFSVEITRFPAGRKIVPFICEFKPKENGHA